MNKHMPLDAKIPSGPIEKKWEKAKFDLKLVNRQELGSGAVALQYEPRR